MARLRAGLGAGLGDGLGDDLGDGLGDGLGDDLGAGLGDGFASLVPPAAWSVAGDSLSPPVINMAATDDEEHAITPTATMILTRLDIFYTIPRD